MFDPFAEVALLLVMAAAIGLVGTLADYHRVQIEPVQVAFHKHWDPTRTGSRIKLGKEERENIRSGVATAVQEAFVKELRDKSRYQVVNEAGPDVLRVKVAIVDLYVNAPDTEGVGMSRTYTVSAGQMTLFAELFDSESGQLLARVIDKREGRDNQMYQLANSVVQRGELQDIALLTLHRPIVGCDSAPVLHVLCQLD